MPEHEKEQYLDLGTASRYTCLDIRVLRELIARGELTAEEVEGQPIFMKSELDELVNKVYILDFYRFMPKKLKQGEIDDIHKGISPDESTERN